MHYTTDQKQLRSIFQRLGFSPHHTGHKLLISAILLYAQDPDQSITKELYPTLAKQSRQYSAGSIERSMRYAITEAWAHGPQKAWQQYFPQLSKAPSNAIFIASLAEHCT